MAATIDNVIEKANLTDIAVSHSRQGKKNVWTITANGASVKVNGNGVAMSMLDMLAANPVTAPAPAIKMKAGVLTKPNKTTKAMMFVCESPATKVSDIAEKFGISKGTAAVIASDTKKVMAYLQGKGRLTA